LFGADAVDFAQLIKMYGNETGVTSEHRYSPAECSGIEKRPITGTPDEAVISTSYIERQNLTMRMGMRRFTRLTNAFYKEGRESCSRGEPSLHALQLLPGPSNPHQAVRQEDDAGDGRWHGRSRLVVLGDREPSRIKLTTLIPALGRRGVCFRGGEKLAAFWQRDHFGGWNGTHRPWYRNVPHTAALDTW
jgi:hypothetical protein